jgi:hypothetical protein
MSCQLHNPAALLLGNDPPAPIREEAGWARHGEVTIFAPPGFKLRPLGRPARSQSLYRLPYRGSFLKVNTTDI